MNFFMLILIKITYNKQNVIHKYVMKPNEDKKSK